MTSFSKVPLIEACPHCEHRYSRPRMASYNGMWDQLYLDGYYKRTCEHLYPPVFKCENCGEFIKLYHLVEIDFRGIEEALLKTYNDITSPDIADLFELTRRYCSDKSDEILYRKLAMWEFNHMERQRIVFTQEQIHHYLSFQKEAIENENKLYRLLSNDDDQDLLIKADILRRRRQFKHATSLMSQCKSQELANSCQLMTRLCELENSNIVSADFNTETNTDGHSSLYGGLKSKPKITKAEMRRNRIIFFLVLCCVGYLIL